MKPCPTPSEVVLAAAAGDERDWAKVLERVYRASKDDVAAVIATCFRTELLAAGVSSPEDIGVAMDRLSLVLSSLVRLPKTCQTLNEDARRPPDHYWSAEEPELWARNSDAAVAQISATIRSHDLVAAKNASSDMAKRMPFLQPGHGRPDSEDDPDFVRHLLEVYAQFYRCWFDREEWNGKPVSKRDAYRLIDSVACAASRKVRGQVVYPILRKLAQSLTDSEVRDAVTLSLSEFEEIDREGLG